MNVGSEARSAATIAFLFPAFPNLHQTFVRLQRTGAIGISLWDARGRLVDANDENLRIFRHRREDLGRSPHWSDLLGPGFGEVASLGAHDLSVTGVCKPFLLRAQPGPDGPAHALVWSVIADDERNIVASCAIDVSGVLAETARTKPASETLEPFEAFRVAALESDVPTPLSASGA